MIGFVGICVHLMSFLVPMILNVPNASFDGCHDHMCVNYNV